MIKLARFVNVPLYVVHVMSIDALDEVSVHHQLLHTVLIVQQQQQQQQGRYQWAVSAADSAET